MARAYLFKAVPSLPANGMSVVGTIDFGLDGDFIGINGTIVGLTPGQHNFHVHQYGDMNNGCNAAGPIFNPTQINPNNYKSLAGNIGPVMANSNGVAYVNLQSSLLTFNGQNSVIGRGLMVHEIVSNPNDFPGTPFGCGVIGIVG
uniref:Superoxide dismutase copper/zinc binding domain-containing protein n=1 Tax=Acrobeloides nanus TaxID=290746 RepID=A0A914CBU5_9BILA